MKIKFYRVQDDYITYLRTFDQKVMHNKKGRPYIGILLEVANHSFIAPLSSPKPKHNYFKNNNTFFKIYSDENYLGLVSINNMIPVLESVLEPIIFDNESEKYRNLLENQYLFLKKHQDKIRFKANKLYEEVTLDKKMHLVRISCNFEILIKNYSQFSS